MTDSILELAGLRCDDITVTYDFSQHDSLDLYTNVIYSFDERSVKVAPAAATCCYAQFTLLVVVMSCDACDHLFMVLLNYNYAEQVTKAPGQDTLQLR